MTPLTLSDAPAWQHGLAGHIAMLLDAGGELTFADILQTETGEQFKPLPGDFNGGYFHRGDIWFRAVLNTPAHMTTRIWWLRLNAPFVDTIDVYTPTVGRNGGISYDHWTSGIFHTLNNPDDFGAYTLIPMDLPSQHTLPIFVRIKGKRALSLDLSIWQATALFRDLTTEAFLYGCMVGMLLLMTVVSLLFGLRLRDRNLLTYSAYVATAGFFFFCRGGYLILIFPSIGPHTYIRLLGVTVFVSSLLGSLFILSIYTMARNFHRLKWAIRFIVWIATAGALVSAAGYYPVIAPASTLVGLALAALAPIIAFRALRRGDLGSLILFVGFVIYGIPLCFAGVQLLGLLPGTALTRWVFPLLVCTHVVVILIGIVEHARLVEIKLAGLNAELLHRAQSESRRLETAVVERTQELQTEIISRRKAEEATLTLLREQRNLLAMVSHEFRSPIGIIKASLALLQYRFPNPMDEAGTAMTKIGRAANRLKALIETCLADEWLERASVTFQPRSVPLNHLVEQLVAERTHASERIISVTASDRLVIQADPVLLSMAIDNLLGNAIAYSDSKTPVDVSIRRSGGHILIAVRDYGDGISPDEQDRIFERYFRGESARSSHGVGLGLHIVRVIAGLHHADVLVDSRPGAGSTFTLRLPAPADEQEAELEPRET